MLIKQFAPLALGLLILAVASSHVSAQTWYDDCEQDEIDTIEAAREAALGMLRAPKDQYRFQRWFGYDPTTPQGAEQKRIVDWFEQTMYESLEVLGAAAEQALDIYHMPNLIFVCTCLRPSLPAYTTENSIVVHICDGFKPLSLRGTDSQAGTLIHEAAHAMFGAKHHAEGTGFCRDLAQADPSKALYNADSHEYYQEDAW
jgi:peptidyl-Lys metalloendopeptidase